MVAFRGTPGEMQITQKAPVKVCYKSSTLSGVYNSITFSEQSPGSVCRGEHSAIHKLYFPLCKAHTRAPSEARWMENTQSALNIARTLSQVSAFSVSETTVVIFIYNGVCVGVSAAALWSGNSSWLRAASGRWKEQHDLILRLECAFLFWFFFFWVHFAASVMAGVFLQIMCLEFWMEGSEWNMCQLQSRHSARETKSEETNWEAKKQKTELEVTRVVSGHLWSVDRWKYHERMRGGGNAVSWSKQPLSLIIITELQLDLEPHQDSGRSGSMESLTLRWINEGIIMRFCKTHSCVRGQKHPIVLQPWQENLAVNTLVLKLGL